MIRIIAQHLHDAAREASNAADRCKTLSARLTILSTHLDELGEVEKQVKLKELGESLEDIEYEVKKIHRGFHSAEGCVKPWSRKWWGRLLWDLVFALIAFGFLTVARFTSPLDVLFHFTVAIIILGVLAWVYSRR